MSTEEAHTLVKALHKADADNSHSNVRDVLQALHDFPGMNELILKETKLGKVVQGFKGKYDNENPEISKFITVILRQWTKIAKSAKGKKGKEPASSQAQTDSTASTTSTAASPVPGPQAQVTQSLTAPPAAPAPPTVAAAKAVVVPTVPTPQRQKIQELLAKTLSISSGEKATAGAATAGKAPDTGPVKIAVEIEQVCWDAYPCDASGKQTAYSAKIRTLNFNLKKNDTLRASVLNGSILPARLIHMTTDQLAASHIAEQRKYAAAEDEESRRRDWLEEHKKEIIANAVHGAGGKIEELMNENKDEEWFDFANELEEVSDDD